MRVSATAWRVELLPELFSPSSISHDEAGPAAPGAGPAGRSSSVGAAGNRRSRLSMGRKLRISIRSMSLVRAKYCSRAPSSATE